MVTLDNEWLARVAASLALAARWLAGFSMMFGASALLILYLVGHVQPLAAGILSLVVLGCAAQAYLLFRIAFDHRLFDQFTREGTDPSAALGAFDQAMAALGLRRGMPTNPSLRDRAAGLVALLKLAGLVLTVQIAFAVASRWLTL